MRNHIAVVSLFLCFALFSCSSQNSPLSPEQKSVNSFSALMHQDSQAPVESTELGISMTSPGPQEVVLPNSVINIKGDIVGVVPGKTYFIQTRVAEDYSSGGGVCPWYFRTFTVFDDLTMEKGKKLKEKIDPKDFENVWSILISDPAGTVKDSEPMKLDGYITGLSPMKTYIVQIRIVEDYSSGGAASPWFYQVISTGAK